MTIDSVQSVTLNLVTSGYVCGASNKGIWDFRLHVAKEIDAKFREGFDYYWQKKEACSRLAGLELAERNVSVWIKYIAKHRIARVWEKL